MVHSTWHAKPRSFSSWGYVTDVLKSLPQVSQLPLPEKLGLTHPEQPSHSQAPSPSMAPWPHGPFCPNLSEHMQLFCLNWQPLENKYLTKHRAKDLGREQILRSSFWEGSYSFCAFLRLKDRYVKKGPTHYRTLSLDLIMTLMKPQSYHSGVNISDMEFYQDLSQQASS